MKEPFTPRNHGLLLFSVLVLAGCSQTPTAGAPGSEGCTEEAKVCPDGTSVGREGPNCEFAACAGDTTQACTEEAKACPDGTTVVRGGPDCEFAACPSDAGTACTDEAKVCPDGSSVSRQGPDCAFAPCPGEPSAGE